MTDKELLELAAKAAGVKGGFVEAFPEDGYPAYACGIGTYASPLLLWNPLTNDGDALRLSVKLSIHIEHAGQSGKKADRVQASPRGHGHLAWVEMYESDHHAATRRAIVQVAAAIGKAMS